MNMKKKKSNIYTVLTIAGSDPIGGAGIQADLKTISAFGLYGMSVITAITAQNTQGVQAVYPVEPEIVAAQLDSVFTDIMPDCVKLGMLANEKIVKLVAEKLKKYKPKKVVIDPVIASSNGYELINEIGRNIMVQELFPLADIITPNLPEAEILMKMGKQTYEIEISNHNDVKRKIAEEISLLFREKTYKNYAILIKGGHFEGKKADDYLYCFYYREKEKQKIVDTFKEFSFSDLRIDNPNTHGTGCTLSSAIACGLAMGKPVEDSVRLAKKYITGAILGGLSIGHGVGPLNHFWEM